MHLCRKRGCGYFEFCGGFGEASNFTSTGGKTFVQKDISLYIIIVDNFFAPLSFFFNLFLFLI